MGVKRADDTVRAMQRKERRSGDALPSTSTVTEPSTKMEQDMTLKDRREPSHRSDPLVRRRGRLRHGNQPGDLSKVPRCGARSKRTGEPCRGPAMRNGRCRLHGGLSTGPRTSEGLARSRRARWKHGRYSVEAQRERRRLKAEGEAFNAAVQRLLQTQRRSRAKPTTPAAREDDPAGGGEHNAKEA